jgi:hypothetical protein
MAEPQTNQQVAIKAAGWVATGPERNCSDSFLAASDKNAVLGIDRVRELIRKRRSSF